MSENFQVETPRNWDEKALCCFVIDKSGSMSGKPIEELQKGIEEFIEEIKSDNRMANSLEIAIVAYDNIIEVTTPPGLVDDVTCPVLDASGTTKTAQAVETAIDLVEQRKQWYATTGQSHKRCWIILITDGAPDYDQNMTALAARIENDTKNKKYIFLPIGVDEADMSALEEISGYEQRDGKWQKMKPVKLKGLKFLEFFSWLSASIGDCKSSDISSWGTFNFE